MEFERVVAIISDALQAHIERPLSDLEIELLRGAWDNLKYEEIAERSGYSLNYLQRDIGPRFWKLLSDVYGRKVNKTSARAILTRWAKALEAAERLELAGTRQKMHQKTDQSIDDLALNDAIDAQASNRVDDEASVITTLTEQPMAIALFDPFQTIPQNSPINVQPLVSFPYPSTFASTEPTQVDWGEAPDVSSFYGRTEELETLTRWMVTERCRMIALLGMGGIGKSSLASKIAVQLQGQFEFVIWRSLRNAPSLETLLATLVPFLSRQQDTQSTPERLLHWLRTHRCLVILDNLETIMQPGDRAGQYQPDYEPYGELFRLLGESAHQSCILLTSREKLAEVAVMESLDAWVRSILLSGTREASLALIKAKRLVGTEDEQRILCDLYNCSPLALKIVASAIQSLFAGEIAPFLQEETIVFNGIRRLLEQQFERLSYLEKTIMYWLAINREWTSIAELVDDIVPTAARSGVLESLESLCWRSLIEKRSGSYTQQPVVMEYVTEQLIHQMTSEIVVGKLNLFVRHALIKTTVKDYIRQSQVRLILKPIAQQCKLLFQTPQLLENQCQTLLQNLKLSPVATHYGGGNLLNLCCHLGMDLAGYDFSRLSIRQAYLVGVMLKQVNFQQVEFIQTAFTQTFGSVLAIAINPIDRNMMASADDTGKVRLWRLDKLELLRSFKGHTGHVWAVTFSPDGQIVVSGSGDKTVRLWNVKSGRLLKVLTGHEGTVRGVAISPDGQIIASASIDGTIKLWERTTGALLATLEGHTGWVRSVAFSPDGEWLVSGSYDHTARVWHVPSRQVRHTLKGHTNLVTDVAFSPDGTLIASGSDDQTVRLWDARTGAFIRALHGHSHWVLTLAFCPDGEVLASGGSDHTIRLWDVQTGRLLHTLQGHQKDVRTVAFAPNLLPTVHPSLYLTANGDRPTSIEPWIASELAETKPQQPKQSPLLVSGGEDQTIRVWNTQDGQLLNTLQGWANWTMMMDVSPDGGLLATSGNNFSVLLWDIETGQVLHVLKAHTHWIKCIAFSPDGKLLATASDDFLIHLWDVVTGRRLKTLNEHQNYVRAIAFSPDSRFLVSGDAEPEGFIWNVATGRVVQRLDGHTGWIESLAYSPQGDRIASSSTDSTIKLWDATTGTLVKTLVEDLRGWDMSLVFYLNGTQLVSSGTDHQVKVWDCSSGALLHIFEGHKGLVWSVCLSPDGTRLATGGDDGTVRLWDVATGKLLTTLEGHEDWVQSVRFHPNGKILISGSKDAEIRFWDIETGECVRSLRVDRPYEGMDITNATGLSEAQQRMLMFLGAIA